MIKDSKKLYTIVIAIVLIIPIIFLMFSRGRTDVDVVSVYKGNIADIVSASGVVESLEHQDIFPDTSGMVRSVLVEEYQKVSVGDRLFVFNNENSKLSPIDGVVTNINIIDGGYATASQPAMTIVNTQKLQIRADIRQDYAQKVQPGQRVRITGAFIEDSQAIFGEIERVAPVAKRVGNEHGADVFVEAVISFDALRNELIPGMNVNCDIITKVKDDVLLISYDAIREYSDGTKTVFVVNDRNVIEEKEITTDIVSGFTTDVVSGLSEGDLVVLDPRPEFVDGVRVNIINEY